MAHNLNKNKETGKVSFVAVGERAWHGLGKIYSDRKGLTYEEVIVDSGMDFEVAKKQIQVIGEEQPIPNYFATQRQDTKDILGIVSGDYEVVQNKEVFTFFDSIIDRGEAIYQTAGVLGLGERIFITAKLPADILVNGETVENYLLLSSGHTGRDPIQIGFTGIRVVCQNTLNAALPGLANKVTILHFKNAKEKLEIAAKAMGMASKYTEQLTPIFNKMADVKISDPKLRAYLEEVMKPPKELIDRETLQARYSTKFVNKVDGMMEFVHSHPTQQTVAAKGTVWGAYNAVSGYYGYQKQYKSQQDKMNDLYFRDGAKKIEKAFTLATELIK